MEDRKVKWVGLCHVKYRSLKEDDRTKAAAVSSSLYKVIFTSKAWIKEHGFSRNKLLFQLEDILEDLESNIRASNFKLWSYTK